MVSAGDVVQILAVHGHSLDQSLLNGLLHNYIPPKMGSAEMPDGCFLSLHLPGQLLAARLSMAVL